jgi:hypothetical protein
MSISTSFYLPVLRAGLAGLMLSGAAQASVSITSSAIFNTATTDYTYSYSVQNLGALDDLVLVTFKAMFSPIGISEISSPIGFSLTADPSQMQINLIEDGSILTPDTFAAMTTVGPFSFRSPIAPGITPYSAFDANGDEFTGTLTAPVPEPSAMFLLGVVAVAGTHLRRRS